VYVGVRGPGLRPVFAAARQARVLALPSSVPCGASFVGVLLPRREAKAVTRVRGAEGVHTLRPVHTVPCAGGRIVGTGLLRVIVLAHRLSPNGIASVGAHYREAGNRKVGRGLGGYGRGGQGERRAMRRRWRRGWCCGLRARRLRARAARVTRPVARETNPAAQAASSATKRGGGKGSKGSGTGGKGGGTRKGGKSTKARGAPGGTRKDGKGGNVGGAPGGTREGGKGGKAGGVGL